MNAVWWLVLAVGVATGVVGVIALFRLKATGEHALKLGDSFEIKSNSAGWSLTVIGLLIVVLGIPAHGLAPCRDRRRAHDRRPVGHRVHRALPDLVPAGRSHHDRQRGRRCAVPPSQPGVARRCRRGRSCPHPHLFDGRHQDHPRPGPVHGARGRGLPEDLASSGQSRYHVLDPVEFRGVCDPTLPPGPTLPPPNVTPPS